MGMMRECLGLALAACTLCGCGSTDLPTLAAQTASSGHGETGTPKSTSCSQTDDPRLFAAVTDAAKRAPQEPSFAGMLTDSCAHVIRVYLTRLDSAVEKRIVRSNQTDDFRFVMSKGFSMRELTDLQSRLSRDSSVLTQQGITVQHSYPSVPLDRLVVKVRGLTGVQRDYLMNRYGPGLDVGKADASDYVVFD
jgi:hypothetical protein